MLNLCIRFRIQSSIAVDFQGKNIECWEIDNELFVLLIFQRVKWSLVSLNGGNRIKTDLVIFTVGLVENCVVEYKIQIYRALCNVYMILFNKTNINYDYNCEKNSNTNIVCPVCKTEATYYE